MADYRLPPESQQQALSQLSVACRHKDHDENTAGHLLGTLFTLGAPAALLPPIALIAISGYVRDNALRGSRRIGRILLSIYRDNAAKQFYAVRGDDAAGAVPHRAVALRHFTSPR